MSLIGSLIPNSNIAKFVPRTFEQKEAVHLRWVEDWAGWYLRDWFSTLVEMELDWFFFLATINKN